MSHASSRRSTATLDLLTGAEAVPLLAAALAVAWIRWRGMGLVVSCRCRHERTARLALALTPPVWNLGEETHVPRRGHFYLLFRYMPRNAL